MLGVEGELEEVELVVEVLGVEIELEDVACGAELGGEAWELVVEELVEDAWKKLSIKPFRKASKLYTGCPRMDSSSVGELVEVVEDVNVTMPIRQSPSVSTMYHRPMFKVYRVLWRSQLDGLNQLRLP